MKALCVLGLLALSSAVAAGQSQSAVTVMEEGLVVDQVMDAGSAELKVFKGRVEVFQLEFDPAGGLVLPFSEMTMATPADGGYSYTVTFGPKVLMQVPADEKAQANGRASMPLTNGSGAAFSGHFRLVGGSVPADSIETESNFERVEK